MLCTHPIVYTLASCRKRCSFRITAVSLTPPRFGDDIQFQWFLTELEVLSIQRVSFNTFRANEGRPKMLQHLPGKYLALRIKQSTIRI